MALAAIGLAALAFHPTLQFAPALLAGRAAAAHIGAFEDGVADPPRSRLLRRVGAAVAAPVRGLWVRCDEQLCRIDGPPINPLALLARLVPRRRPLSKLQLCEEGTIKVRTTGTTRTFEMHPTREEKETCSVDAALDMF